MFFLVLTVISSPAYAIVELYNVQLLCPIDSFDFTGVTTQFDALTLCEVSGTIINPDVVSNFYQSDALPPIVLQIVENPDETPQVSLSDQLDSIFDTQKKSILAELQDFLRKNYSLKNSLADVETELGQLIKILKEKIALLKTKISEGTSKVNIDDIITEQDLDKIARDFLSKKSFIQPAYADMFVFQEKAKELIELMQNKTDVELENLQLEKKIKELDDIKSDLLKEELTIDQKISLFKNIFGDKLDKIKESTKDLVKGIKDMFR